MSKRAFHPSECECRHPGVNRGIRYLVTLPNRPPKRVCYYCASGYESVPGVVIEPLPRLGRRHIDHTST
jgi:hypothetical protein